MKRATRLLTLISASVLFLGTFAIDETPELWQNPQWKIWTGLFTTALILAQWSLTLGRMVFQATGSRWLRRVAVHKWLGLLLPVALLAHALTLGYGLLIVLPLAMLGAGWLGAGLGEKPNPQALRWHVILSAMTLAMMLVHIYVTTFYN